MMEFLYGKKNTNNDTHSSAGGNTNPAQSPINNQNS